ncbi:LytTR family DNA-binding domain-containing protein [Phenylobacterium sp. LjRoot225]|uniref:LytTR family DNA-binding domain-containing protein n=1 Tax=Phenylobacterium sp. LjRoot225 TaxID=3342285 RepID=UPI003ECCC461
MTRPLREAPPAAVRASPTAWPGRAAVGRTALAGAVVGLFLGLVGAYGSEAVPIVPRTLEMVAIAVTASLMGMAVFVLTGRHPAIAARWWLHGLAAALVMTAPMAVVVWIALQAVMRPGPPATTIPGFLPTSAVTSAFFCLWVAYQRRRRMAPNAAAAAPAAPKILDRLPPRLRGAELWAVEAEDHYLRLHTSLGQDLILLRFSDALGELEGLEGTQVHRSWWVARGAILEARRADGRAVLKLKGGVQAPVSRTFARGLRSRGWI